MSWDTFAPIGGGALLALITAAASVMVARNGSGDRNRDRESQDIWHMVEQMQKQLDRAEVKSVQDEMRIEQLESKVDEQRSLLRQHEDKIAELTREKLALQLEVASLRRRLGVQEERRDGA